MLTAQLSQDKFGDDVMLNKNRPIMLLTSTEANNLFAKWDSLGVPCSSVDSISVEETISYLLYTNQWSLLDCIGKFDVHNKTAALVDWKNPNKMFTIVNDYAGSFTAYVGFKGNGTNFRIITPFNPADGGTYNYTQNSAFYGWYCNTNDVLSSKIDISATTSGNKNVSMGMLNANVPKKIFGTINSTNHAYNKIINQTYGWHMVKRTASNSFYNIKNGQDIWMASKGTTVSTTVQNLPFVLFCRAVNNTTFSVFNSRTCKGFVAGGGSVSEQLVVNGLNKYSLGVNSIPKSMLILDGNSFTSAGYYLHNFFSNYTASNQVADMVSATPGRLLSEIVTDFPTTTGLVDVSGYTKTTYVIQELTNQMSYTGSDVGLCHSKLTTLVAMARATYGANCKIGIVTCLPRGGTAPILESNRQNPSNLNDTTTINGWIRTNYLSIGADYLIDWALDPIMGVAGAYTNTTYFATDECHPTPFGYQYLNTNYFYPIVSPYL